MCSFSDMKDECNYIELCKSKDDFLCHPSKLIIEYTHYCTPPLASIAHITSSRSSVRTVQCTIACFKREAQRQGTVAMSREGFGPVIFNNSAYIFMNGYKIRLFLSNFGSFFGQPLQFGLLITDKTQVAHNTVT
jgi:hypothetical protein